MTPPYLPRGWDTGPNEDPLAALIGKGLQAFGAVKTARQQEADRQQRLQREDAQERDTRDWRDLQSGIALSNAGLTTQAPPSAPVVTPQAGSKVAGLDAGLGQTPDITPGPPPNPVERLGGISLYRAGPSAAEQKATVADDRQRVIHQRVGHALAQQLGWETPGHPVDDETAEGLGAAPASFAAFQKAGEHNIDPLSDEGIRRSVERDRQGIAAGNKITEKQRADAGDATAMQSAHSDLSAMENTHKGAVAEVARWVASPSVGRLIPGSIGTGIVDIIRQARSAGLSDDAQSYLKRMFDFSSLAGPARYGRRFGSEIALQQIWNDFGGAQLGIGQGGIGATQKNRANAVRARRTSAGEPAWNEAQQVPTDTGTERSGGPPNQRGHYRPDNPHIPKFP